MLGHSKVNFKAQPSEIEQLEQNQALEAPPELSLDDPNIFKVRGFIAQLFKIPTKFSVSEVAYLSLAVIQNDLW